MYLRFYKNIRKDAGTGHIYHVPILNNFRLAHMVCIFNILHSILAIIRLLNIIEMMGILLYHLCYRFNQVKRSNKASLRKVITLIKTYGCFATVLGGHLANFSGQTIFN